MANSDREKERRRLAELYAGMSDGELAAIAADRRSLTDAARAALNSEISRCRSIASTTESDAAPSQEPEFRDLVRAARFRDYADALFAKSFLESAGIKSYLFDENLVRLHWFISNAIGGIKLMVRPEDIDATREILAQSAPESFQVEGIGEYLNLPARNAALRTSAAVRSATPADAGGKIRAKPMRSLACEKLQ
jgi:hypothetical protein